MYVVRESENGVWEVVDQTDLPVFRGTKQQCEDWLDAVENRSLAKTSHGLLSRLRQRIFGPRSTIDGGDTT